MNSEFMESLQIHSYKFSKKGLKEYELNPYVSSSWPIVYIIKNDKEAYVGESTNAYARMKNHLANERRDNLKEILMISCDKFNKSATLDIESLLISYMDADRKYKLQNGNAGLVDHRYYQRSSYRVVFEHIWDQLRQKDYAKNPIDRLDNSDFFKYSPYKSLSVDQHNSVVEILNVMANSTIDTIFVEGGAGTGKSVLAIYLMKLLVTEIEDYHLDESDDVYSEQINNLLEFKKRYPNPKVALVVPMTSLRKTLKNVLGSVKGLKANMVIGPSEVIKEDYDIILVDEAHRLRQRISLPSYTNFDMMNRELGLDKHEGTQLDWIIKKSKHQILFYDETQTIKPTDIDKERFSELKKGGAKSIQLSSQLRVKGGSDYIEFVDNLLHARFENGEPKFTSKQYDLRIYDSLSEMRRDVLNLEKDHGLCRLLAGYSWPWLSKNDPNSFDIEIDGLKLKWNSVAIDWVNSANAVNEVGCIHTSQGYDLNYAGVIFGNEIKFNPKTKEIEIDRDEYHDGPAKRGIKKPGMLKEYIINIYKTMMLRGIKGTFIYVSNPELRNYLQQFILDAKEM